jgi:uncharacterized membrane protein
MLIVALVFVFFALLAVAYELHTITDRIIEIGTIVEHFNRRSLRASDVKSDDDFAGESITKTHRRWAHVVGAIVLAALASIGILTMLGVISLR